MGTKKIVVVGGGIAGMETATRLGRHYANSDTEIMLIDKNAYHVWKPMLHRFAAGTALPSEEGIAFIQQAKKNGFRYIPGTVESIRPTEKTIQIGALQNADGLELFPERTIQYDKLVISAGSRTNDFGTPGVKEFAYTIDNLTQASRFFQDFYAKVVYALNCCKSIHITIVGGGASGIELAGEIYQYLDLASSYRPAGVERTEPVVQITVVESNARILKTFTPTISASVKKVLENLGARVLEGERVVEVFQDHVQLKSGEAIPSDLTVWTTGVQAPECVSSIEKLSHAKGGQIIINESLQSVDDPDIFALGDSSAMLDQQTGQVRYPPTAQAAQQQAVYLTKYLPKILAGETVPTFTYHDRGSIVTVSRFDSFGVFGQGVFKGSTFHGYKAMLAHIMLYRMHQVTLLGVPRTVAFCLAEKLNAYVKPPVRMY